MPQIPILNWKQRNCDNDYKIDLQKRGLPLFLADILARRENLSKYIKNKEKTFLYPKQIDISDFQHFNSNIIDIADLLNESVLQEQNIGLIGDYDVDGIMSCAIMYLALKELASKNNKTIDPIVLLPSRLKEGYGLNNKTIESYKDMWQNKRPSITIVLDSGSSSKKCIEALKSWHNHKVIIIDHHIVNQQEKSSNATHLLNWRENFNTEMCSSSLAYLVIKHIFDKYNFNSTKYLTFAAIATVADMIPCDGINRTIVKNGLNKIYESGSYGLVSLGGSKILSTQNDISFCIAPKLNAIGRVDSPNKSFEILTTNDQTKIRNLTDIINQANKQRKEIQKNIENEAKQIALQYNFDNGIFIYKEDWTPSICGIAATSLVETFYMPCILMGSYKDEIKGSGRSLEHINIKDIMDTISFLFDKYGGHNLACGASLKKDMIHQAPIEFDKACKIYYQKFGKPSRISWYDSEIKLSDLTYKNQKLLLDLLHPYSHIINPEPIFLIKNLEVKHQEIKEGDCWKMNILSCHQNNKMIKLSTFDQNIVCENLIGKNINIFVKFKQSFEEEEDFIELVGLY